MAIYTGDQQNTLAIIINGVKANATGAIIKAQPTVAANTTYTFTDNYSMNWQGAPISFRRGCPYVLDTTLKAVLLAASAPMVVA